MWVLWPPDISKTSLEAPNAGIKNRPSYPTLSLAAGVASPPDANTVERTVVFSIPELLVVQELGLPLAPTIFVLLGPDMFSLEDFPAAEIHQKRHRDSELSQQNPGNESQPELIVSKESTFAELLPSAIVKPSFRFTR
ncbi:hypothetical protein ILUMI_13904 [Ignelater luminosus]|uniref:Uncharacterized protein n=1 Tax=Ignelater luminosus TaxID=2038154 RepID=A0A8K0CWX1_IGNLU|nr:hypothetical protein ILUMI_13904 [Ignelater luminosus]